MEQQSVSPGNHGQQEAFPSVGQQVMNLTAALVDFVADGCTTVTKEQYGRRLEICETCEQRRGLGCMKCGCRLRWKARGRAFSVRWENGLSSKR